MASINSIAASSRNNPEIMQFSDTKQYPISNNWICRIFLYQIIESGFACHTNDCLQLKQAGNKNGTDNEGRS